MASCQLFQLIFAEDLIYFASKILIDFASNHQIDYALSKLTVFQTPQLSPVSIMFAMFMAAGQFVLNRLQK